MTPKLFEKGTQYFSGGGICRLHDAASWTVTEVLNGEFELEMAYPAEGEFFSEIKTERIIYARPNPFDDPQAFEIYAISAPLRGRIKIYAHHVSYRQNKITVSPFSASSASGALSAIKNASVNANPFTFSTNMSVAKEINSNIPRTLRNALYGRIIPLYGGEVKYDSYNVSLLARRGSNKGYAVRYGINLIDLQRDEDVSNVYDGIYPYYFVQDIEDEEDFTYVELPEKIIKIGTTSEKIMPLNLTAEFPEEPDEEELREKANAYLNSNDINAGVLGFTVNFVLLPQTEEYKHLQDLESVELGDDISVYVPKRGVTVHSRVIKTVYNGKKDKYDSIGIGDLQADIADTVASVKNEVVKTSANVTNSQNAIASVKAETNANSAKISLVVETSDSGKNSVRGSILAEAINGQSTVKISADVLDIDGKKLNIKVDAANIEGTLTAKQINADGLTVKNGTIDNCTINENCEIKGVLTGSKISTHTAENGAYGAVEFYESAANANAWYTIKVKQDLLEAGVRIGSNNGEPDVFIYTEYSQITLRDFVDIHSIGYMKLQAGTGGTLVGDWTGTLSTSSDARKKRDITKIPNAWEKVFDALAPSVFRYNESEELHFGLIAQELAAAIAAAGYAPEDFALLRRDKDGYYSIIYDELIALNISETQKLKARMAKLERIIVK